MADYLLSVDVIGAKELSQAMQSVNSKAKQAIKNALNKTAILVERKARSLAPHHHGGLWNSLHTEPAVETQNNIEAKVGTNLKYALYQEKGTRPHIVRAINKKVLYSKEKNVFFGKQVLIPEMPGKFFMRKAKDETKPDMANNLEAAMKVIVSTLAVK